MVSIYYRECADRLYHKQVRGDKHVAPDIETAEDVVTGGAGRKHCHRQAQ